MESAYILGAKINDITNDEAIDQIKKLLKQNRNHFLITPNPEICLLSYYSKPYRRILYQADISIPDGFGLKIGALILGEKLTKRTTGADLAKKVLQLAEQKNYSVLLLGGQTPEVGQKAQKNIKAALPRLRINFLFGGKFDYEGNSEDPNLIKKINQINPDIIFVCLGAPKQEKFMQKNLHLIQSQLMLGLGGTIDYFAGKIKRAPPLMRMLGLEWLWRLMIEPHRIGRIYNALIKFPLACFAWRYTNTFVYRKNVAGLLINNSGQIFLGKNTRGYWQIPQGGVKKSEPLENAIRRELKDEIGIDKFIIIDKLVNCYKYTGGKKSFIRRFYRYKGQRQSLFLLKFTGRNEDIKLSPHDFVKYQWVDKNQAINWPTGIKKEIIKIGLNNFKF